MARAAKSVVRNAGRLEAKLKFLKEQSRRTDDVSFEVGYRAPYAVFVHENREMKLRGQPRPSGIGEYWGPSGRAGFLLDVMRETAGALADTVRRVRKVWKKSTVEAVRAAGEQLLRASQENVPVEYGELRASGFVRVRKGGRFA